MINRKDKSVIESEFENHQLFLLYHKYLYYELGKSVIEDFYFDISDSYSFKLALNLGFRADKMRGPKENERHHIHWMVGFNSNSEYWEKCKSKYKVK